MGKTLLNEMYAWCWDHPQCVCAISFPDQYSDEWPMEGNRGGPVNQPANTIGDNAY